MHGATTNWLVKNGINARYVLSVDNAKEFLDNHDVDLVLSDFRLDNGNGMELLEWMNTHGYRIPFLIMTGYGDIPGAVEAVKKWCRGLSAPKPVQTEKGTRYLSREKHWNVREGTAIQTKILYKQKPFGIEIAGAYPAGGSGGYVSRADTWRIRGQARSMWPGRYMC